VQKKMIFLSLNLLSASGSNKIEANKKFMPLVLDNRGRTVFIQIEEFKIVRKLKILAALGLMSV